MLRTNSIIAVHGIETTSPRTWTYRQDKVTDGSGVNWLSDEDMLPGVVPQARIWVFDYNSNYTESAQEVYIGGVGETLLKSIEHEDTLGKRPLVFIGSCFGGLVVAQVRGTPVPLDARLPTLNRHRIRANQTM